MEQEQHDYTKSETNTEQYRRSREKIRENLGKDAASALLPRSEVTTASEKNELKRTAEETAEETNDDEESKA